MSDIHITPELLAAVAKGDVPVRVLTEIGWTHLMSLCPTCREGLRLWQQQRSDTAWNYDLAFRVLPALLEHRSKEADAEHAKSEKDLRELLKLNPEERASKIQRAHSRFRGLVLAQRILAEAKKQMPGNPARMYDLAETAETVLLRTPQTPGYFDVLARATAYKANALRARGQIREADERITGARSLIRSQGVTDMLVYAEVDAIEGVVREDQRRFKEAGELLTRSASLYQLAGESIEASRVLIVLGAIYHHQQDTQRAIAATQAALANVSEATEPRLYLCGRHNLSLFLVEAGQYDAATEMMLADADLYKQFADLWTKLRQRWLQGKIAFGTGHLEEAESAFLTVREGFVGQGIGYDAAMASLDLALLYLKEGRMVDVQRLAGEMQPIFEAADVHPEAISALLLFQEAARQQAVTVELVEDLAVYLKRARENPELRFIR